MKREGERDAMPWWAGLRADLPVVQRCRECSAWRWPARALCNRCGSFDAGWEPISRRARVASWIVNQHAFSASFPVPYAIVLGRLEEQSDLILPGLYRGDVSKLHIDLPIRASIQPAANPPSSDAPGEINPLLSWVDADDPVDA